MGLGLLVLSDTICDARVLVARFLICSDSISRQMSMGLDLLGVARFNMYSFVVGVSVSKRHVQCSRPKHLCRYIVCI